MSVLNNSNAISAGGAYNITDSLRLRGDSSAYLERTFSTPTDNKKFTISLWTKISQRYVSGSAGTFLSSADGFNTGDVLIVESGNIVFGNGYANYYLKTNQVLRDPSAWYHIIAVYDSANATSSDRLKLYINGERVTSFASATYPSLNYTFKFNSAETHRIGIERTYRDFDGYITEFNFVDGQALDPSYFGETNADGVWSPKEYTGTYGTNGFYLPMKETTQANGFNTITYTAINATQSFTNVGFSPDLVWIKSRDNSTGHQLFDTVRGALKRISSNNTAAEDTPAGSLTSFDADGFTIGNAGSVNGTGTSPFVAWCWDAGSSTVSNTDGTITSSVRANPATGFSVVTYTGNGTNGASIGHGLGTAPKVGIFKRRNTAEAWAIFVDDGNFTWSSDYYQFDTGGKYTNYGMFHSAPTSSTVQLGSIGSINASGSTYVGYLWSEVSGYSKFGSYTGNGSTSGPTVTTGFRPAFVMIKRTDSTGNWIMLDATRDVNNEVGQILYADSSLQEGTGSSGVYRWDFLSDGFQVKGTGSSTNASGGTYIYMAFADTRDYQWNFDASGNKNNWTPNNINSNASSETTYDLMSDTPSLADEDTSNFCTLNSALQNPNSGTLSEANLAWSANGYAGSRGTFGMTSGKWYWEVTSVSGSNNGIGISQDQEALGFLGNAYGWAYYNNGLKYTSGSGTSYGASFTTGDVIGVAFDADAGSLVFYKNGVSQGTAYTGLTSAPYYPAVASYYGSTKLNFGQRPFKYTPPTGYKKLNTFNLPDSSITDGSQHFNTVTYTGNGSTQTITGVGFSPDFLWGKSRSLGYLHNLTDTVRGLTKYLYSESTNSEFTTSDKVTAVTSDGFTLGADTSTNGSVNISGQSQVMWCWRGSDSTAVSNTDGTITSTVSANTTAGFSIVSYTGNSTNGATIGHGLGVAPKVVIVKNRDGGWQWIVDISNITGTTHDHLILNSTAAKSSSDTYYSAKPTSTVFSVNGASYSDVGTSPYKYIAYCFAEVEGFSKFGSYKGNGSSDGTFVYTGFRPAFVMIKVSDSSNSWGMNDSIRNLYNPAQQVIWADLSNADEDRTARQIDLLSNGFKIRSTEANCNTSGGTYIYMCFAENPFKNSLAR